MLDLNQSFDMLAEPDVWTSVAEILNSSRRFVGRASSNSTTVLSGA